MIGVLQFLGTLGFLEIRVSFWGGLFNKDSMVYWDYIGALLFLKPPTLGFRGWGML